MNHPIRSLAGLVYYSPRPQALAAFYRDALGVPLAVAEHGTVGPHHEGLLDGVHLAVWDAASGHGGDARVVPVFRVDDVRGAHDELVAAGVARRHKLIELGEGKRVVGFADDDGRAFRLIELDELAPPSTDAAPTDAVASVSALVFFSPDPARLASFTAAHLGLVFRKHGHGDADAHHEARLGETRFAILPEASPDSGRLGAYPTFLVRQLDAFMARLAAASTPVEGTVLALGGGKRLAAFRDPDGNPFHLIDLGSPR